MAKITTIGDDIRTYVSANRMHSIRTYVLILPSLPPPFAITVAVRRLNKGKLLIN